jgi:hypothetical protein
MNERVGLSGLVKRRAKLAGDIEDTHEALRKMVLLPNAGIYPCFCTAKAFSRRGFCQLTRPAQNPLFSPTLGGARTC